MCSDLRQITLTLQAAFIRIGISCCGFFHISVFLPHNSGFITGIFSLHMCSYLRSVKQILGSESTLLKNLIDRFLFECLPTFKKLEKFQLRQNIVYLE